MSDIYDQRAAKRLERLGYTHREIARAVGVSHITVRRWLIPGERERDLARSRAWKEKNAERRKAYDREYRLARRRACPLCSRPMDDDTEMCRACHRALADFRQSIIIGCYQDGWLIREIAEVMECSVSALSPRMYRLRQRGLLGYRYVVGPDGMRRPNHAG